MILSPSVIGEIVVLCKAKATDLFVGLSGSLKPSFKSRCFGLAEGVVCCSLEERSHPDWKWPFTGLPLIVIIYTPLIS